MVPLLPVTQNLKVPLFPLIKKKVDVLVDGAQHRSQEKTV